jgi:hypothetical protein
MDTRTGSTALARMSHKRTFTALRGLRSIGMLTPCVWMVFIRAMYLSDATFVSSLDGLSMLLGFALGGFGLSKASSGAQAFLEARGAQTPAPALVNVGSAGTVATTGSQEDPNAP